MHPVKSLLVCVSLTLLGLLIVRQQTAQTLLLYDIHSQERLARHLEEERQLLQAQIHALASPKRLTSVLARRTNSLEGPPAAVVKVERPEERSFKLAKRPRGLLERLSLIRTAEARSP